MIDARLTFRNFGSCQLHIRGETKHEQVKDFYQHFDVCKYLLIYLVYWSVQQIKKCLKKLSLSHMQ